MTHAKSGSRSSITTEGNDSASRGGRMRSSSQTSRFGGKHSQGSRTRASPRGKRSASLIGSGQMSGSNDEAPEHLRKGGVGTIDEIKGVSCSPANWLGRTFRRPHGHPPSLDM